MTILHLFERSAISFEGFDVPKQDEQPEIIDPKTGKPFDLNDPAFPVVKGHKFLWKYWAMPRTPNHIILYLREHYDYFNRKRFNGLLTRPNLMLLKDVNAAKMKLRGLWVPATRDLKISPNLFNAPHEGWVNRVLIHEMCHQEVTDHRGGESEEKGHGPKWRAAMLRTGLTPSRFDTESNETYMDKQEKKVLTQDREKFKDYYAGRKVLVENRVPVTKVVLGMKAVLVDARGVIHTVRVESQKGKFYSARTIDESPELTFKVLKAHLFHTTG